MPEPVALAHAACDEIEGALGHREPFRLIENDAGIDQRRDHQPVPVGQHFVVEAGPHAPGARLQQDRAQARKPRFVSFTARQSLEPIEDVMAFEVAFVSHVVVAREELAGFRADQFDDLVFRPDVELALLAFRIGIE